MEQNLLDVLDILTYISDAQTYELLYWNQSAQNFAYNRNAVPGSGCKCYQALFGQTEPCLNCQHSLLSENGCQKQYADARTGRSYLMRRSITELNGRSSILVTGTDISCLPLSAANKNISSFAERDPITGLFSQAEFCRQADRLRHEFPQSHYVFIRMDVDKFRIFNDAFGMQEGNRLLSFIAQTLRQHIGPHDCCGHMFADVFCVMTDQPTNDAAEKFMSSIGGSFCLPNVGTSLKSTPLLPAAGIYRPADNCELSIACLEKAGFAHKFAKTAPLPHCKFYNDSIREQQRREKMIEFQMEDALKSGQFLVYLQPKYDLHTHHVVGAEALVRWNHPTLGIISPDQFIPLFERNGFILQLDSYIWRETCRLQRSWIDQGLSTVPISVNVSRLHLCNSEFRSTVVSLTNHYRLSPKMLELELTESLFIQDADELAQVLQSLRSDGFSINMDDFGNGYSSLNFLDGLEVDVLKLDCGFLKGHNISPRSRTILRHMIVMARELGMQIVMEGVETPEQAQLLMDYGCDIIQGFYFSRPIPAEQFAKQYLCSYSAS